MRRTVMDAMNRRYGMKLHIGVDSRHGLSHSALVVPLAEPMAPERQNAFCKSVLPG